MLLFRFPGNAPPGVRDAHNASGNLTLSPRDIARILKGSTINFVGQNSTGSSNVSVLEKPPKTTETASVPTDEKQSTAAGRPNSLIVIMITLRDWRCARVRS